MTSLKNFFCKPQRGLVFLVVPLRFAGLAICGCAAFAAYWYFCRGARGQRRRLAQDLQKEAARKLEVWKSWELLQRSCIYSLKDIFGWCSFLCQKRKRTFFGSCMRHLQYYTFCRCALPMLKEAKNLSWLQSEGLEEISKNASHSEAGNSDSKKCLQVRSSSKAFQRLEEESSLFLVACSSM